MLVPERQQEILEYIQKHHSATVSELAQRFFASETSIRRDLNTLASSGKIRRTHGGAVLVESENSLLSLSARQETDAAEKQLIAEKALSLIHDGDALFIDSSSTALYMVDGLRRFSSLTVFTNGLKLALMLCELPNIRVFCSGGQVSKNICSFSGAAAVRAIEAVHVNIAFLSPKAIDRSGAVYCTEPEETRIRQAMLEHADRTMLLVCSKKLGMTAPFRMCDLSEVDGIICQSLPPDQWQEIFHRASIEYY